MNYSKYFFLLLIASLSLWTLGCGFNGYIMSSKGRIYLEQYSGSKPFPAMRMLSIPTIGAYEDNQGYVWVVGDGSIFKYKLDQQVARYNAPDIAFSFNQGFEVLIHEYDDDIWFIPMHGSDGYTGNIYHYDRLSNIFNSIENSVVLNKVFSLNDGTIAIVSIDTVNCFSLFTRELREPNKLEAIVTGEIGEIDSVFYTQGNRIWSLNSENLIQSYSINKSENTIPYAELLWDKGTVISLYEDKIGDIWIRHRDSILYPTKNRVAVNY
ncbi:MAG: hypothetical protein AAFY76_02850, partial [Cyanobacteria bacterium J06649_11]